MVTDVRMPICRCYQAFIAQLEQGVDQTHPVADLDAMQREVWDVPPSEEPDF